MGDTLTDLKLKFEDLPNKSYKIKSATRGGKEYKMANSETKVAKRYTKTRGEHIKDIVITILVTAIFAFVVGMISANEQQARIDRAVQASKPSAEIPAQVKK